MLRALFASANTLRSNSILPQSLVHFHHQSNGSCFCTIDAIECKLFVLVFLS